VTRVTVEHGTLEGLEVDGLHYFRNIPYAAPPFGPRRFQPPVAPEAWDGIRDATKPGPAAPQPPEENPLKALYTVPETGEDCLTLEVWTPDPGTSGLPVMVHIHGGAYAFGAGSLLGYTGQAFARDGVVHVGINYRLGIEGFLYLGEGHDNLGLRDQTAALEWVQRNIRSFGGDPDRVTIFGQSGGGVSVMNNLAMPGSRGLFALAIAQSGCSVPSVDADEAMRVTRQVAKKLGVAPTAEGMAGVPLSRTIPETMKTMVRFATRLALGDPGSLLISPFRTVHGTSTVPLSPLESARAGTDAPVPLMTGTVRNETADFVAAFATFSVLGPLVRGGLRRALKLPRATRDAYRALGIRDANGLAEAGWSDWGFRIPTIMLAEERRSPTWLYEFHWQPSTVPANTGSFHAIDVPFSRDALGDIMAVGDPAIARFGPNPPQALATEMHDTWIRFATTGDPGWPVYETDTRPTMVFDTPSHLVSDAAGAVREAWVGHR
jgi:para-nitrobenzyl esterase